MSSTNPLSPRAPTSNRRLRDTLLLVLLFAMVFAGLAGLAAVTGWEETWAQIARLAGWQVAVLLALSLVNYAARGLRWHLFARSIGLATSLTTNFRHFLAGFAMSATPGRLGELVRMRWIGRETGAPFTTSGPLMLVDRASDVAATGLLLGAALALSAHNHAFGLPATVFALSVAALVTRPSLLRGVANLGAHVTRRFGRLFAGLRQAADALARFTGVRLLGLAGGLGLVGWFAEGYAFHLLLTWMGSDIGVARAVAIFFFSGLAGAVTGAPGGVGGAEAAMVALLALEGVGLEVSVPATAIIRLTTLWFAVLIGFVVFPFAERYSLRNAHAVENH